MLMTAERFKEEKGTSVERVLNLLENSEILLFRNFKEGFSSDKNFPPEKWKQLEEEFDRYIKKLRELFESLQGNFSMQALFAETAGNDWVALRQRFLEPAMKKAQKKKETTGSKKVLH